MSEDLKNALEQISVDRSNLYREEAVTDLRVATIRVLTPIRPDGSPDASRPKRFMAQTQLLTQAGPVPLQAPIDATTLEEAMDRFPEAIQRGVEALMEEARQLRREEASRIVIPGVPPPGSKILG